MISPDLPITKSEEDALNRSNFAKNLAQAVIQCTFPTSFSIGLYGKWGSGKTGDSSVRNPLPERGTIAGPPSEFCLPGRKTDSERYFFPS